MNSKKYDSYTNYSTNVPKIYRKICLVLLFTERLFHGIIPIQNICCGQEESACEYCG